MADTGIKPSTSMPEQCFAKPSAEPDAPRRFLDSSLLGVTIATHYACTYEPPAASTIFGGVSTTVSAVPSLRWSNLAILSLHLILLHVIFLQMSDLQLFTLGSDIVRDGLLESLSTLGYIFCAHTRTTYRFLWFYIHSSSHRRRCASAYRQAGYHAACSLGYKQPNFETCLHANTTTRCIRYTGQGSLVWFHICGSRILELFKGVVHNPRWS
ncbi:hypothetical protein BDR05DRAFT_762156 [Suillus weaverae]|nr:hypothetical protein BDR05DRAFT_762156 [Suillus weaverae]